MVLQMYMYVICINIPRYMHPTHCQYAHKVRMHMKPVKKCAKFGAVSFYGWAISHTTREDVTYTPVNH